jgi:hypothetical protein
MAELRKYPPSVGRCVCAHPAGSQRPAWKAARYAGYASSFAARVPATQVSDRGRIQLKLTRAGSSALLSMRDNGIGLAPEHPDSIFSLFTPVDSSPARQGGGLGIGLTLVRCVLELHGGRGTERVSLRFYRTQIGRQSQTMGGRYEGARCVSEDPLSHRGHGRSWPVGVSSAGSADAEGFASGRSRCGMQYSSRTEQ